METFEELERLKEELNNSVEDLRTRGEELAKAEHAYRVALSKSALGMKHLGFTGGMVDKIIYGHKDVADLRLKRDTAQVLYDATKERINIIKLNIRIAMTQLQMDYGIAGQM